jgi:hypothetical protein
MRAFTHDLESVDLTPDEMNAFGTLVKAACYPDLQHTISAWLALTSGKKSTGVCDQASRQVERMWRTESRM